MIRNAEVRQRKRENQSKTTTREHEAKQSVCSHGGVGLCAHCTAREKEIIQNAKISNRKKTTKRRKDELSTNSDNKCDTSSSANIM